MGGKSEGASLFLVFSGGAWAPRSGGVERGAGGVVVVVGEADSGKRIVSVLQRFPPALFFPSDLFCFCSLDFFDLLLAPPSPWG